MDTDAADGNEVLGEPAPERVMVVITEALSEGDLLDELNRNLPPERASVVLVAPAIGETALHRALGDVDGATREARQRLELSLEALSRRGVSAFGEVGVSDPVAAATDALRQYPAEKVLIVATPTDRGRWLEDGLFERARESLHPPVRLIAIGQPQTGHAAAGIGGPSFRAGVVERSARPFPRLPRLGDGDRVAIAIAVIGAIIGISAIAILLIALID